MKRLHLKAESPSPTSGLPLALALSISLLAISIARLAGDLGNTAFNLDLARHALDGPIWRSRLGFNLAAFASALTVLHIALGLVCWLLARITEYAVPKARCKRRDWIVVWFLGGVLWLLIANASWYPNSSLGDPYREVVLVTVLGIDLVDMASLVLTTGVAVIVILAVRRRFAGRSNLILAITAAFGVAAAFSVDIARSPRIDPARPHIILLGIDSLRPDVIDARNAPHMTHFMDGAVQMTDAITPLARTFPSWTSVLTGRHPHTTGAHMNLLPDELIQIGTTLPDILREHGYRTHYAIDETRFSNIDASYGFDTTMTPTMGGSDFMLSRLADTPLSNIIVNTWIGALIFPHLHANRAATHVYNPDTFVRRIEQGLDLSRPSFVAIHLTLPHWPFTWATSQADPFERSTGELYRASIRRADQQFGELLALFERRGALDNALVIALSDHGEALGRPDDLMPNVFPDEGKEALAYQQWGHGTSVFSPHQYRVALGFRAYGAISQSLVPPDQRLEPVSLIDLAPTILDLIGIESDTSFDGVSLAPLLLRSANDSPDFNNRIRFTESEYNPQGFDSREFSTSQLTAAAQIYRLDPITDRLTVRTEMLEFIMSSRQYAAFFGHRAMGAAVPGKQSDASHEFVFVPLSISLRPDGEPRNPVAVASDSELLQQALQDRFTIRFPGAP